jgi:hypothetical protein
MLRDLCRAIEHKHGPKPALARSGWMRIGQVLSSPQVRTEIDDDFLRYFCDELYPARNPTLHGQRPDIGCQDDAAAKLATIEYVMGRLGDWMTGAVVARLEELPESTFKPLMTELEGRAASHVGGD